MNPFTLMQQAKNFQEALKKFQDELVSVQVTGEAGAGMVKVIMDGHYHTHRVEIDDEVYKEDKLIVTSLLAAAASDAAKKVKHALEEKMSKISSSLGLPANFTLPFIPN